MISKNRALLYLIVYLWIGLISVLHPDSVLGARLAGEEDVTSTDDRQPPKIKKTVPSPEQDLSSNKALTKPVPQNPVPNKIPPKPTLQIAGRSGKSSPM